MENVQKIYDYLWKESIEKFKDNKFELDYYLSNKVVDHRMGISLIGRLNSNIMKNISNFLNECKSLEPNQHYYDINDIHITILTIITCFEGFTIDSIDKKAYIDIIKKSIKDEGPLRILFKGITASPSCILIQGFPLDNRLSLLRQQLRDNFRNSALHSIDKRYTIEAAHSTVIRFKDPISNNNLFIDCLNKYKHYDFGIAEIDNIEFVYNDWYMTNSVVSKIQTFVL